MGQPLCDLGLGVPRDARSRDADAELSEAKAPVWGATQPAVDGLTELNDVPGPALTSTADQQEDTPSTTPRDASRGLARG